MKLNDFTRGFVSTVEPSNLTNIAIDQDGVMRPRKGWKTFAGMVYQLWLLNKRFTKLGVKGNFTVTLPLPDGGYKHKKGER